MIARSSSDLRWAAAEMAARAASGLAAITLASRPLQIIQPVKPTAMPTPAMSRPAEPLTFLGGYSMLLAQGECRCSAHSRDGSSSAKASPLYLPVQVATCVCDSASHRGTVACGEARQKFLAEALCHSAWSICHVESRACLSLLTAQLRLHCEYPSGCGLRCEIHCAVYSWLSSTTVCCVVATTRSTERVHLGSWLPCPSPQHQHPCASH